MTTAAFSPLCREMKNFAGNTLLCTRERNHDGDHTSGVWSWVNPKLLCDHRNVSKGWCEVHDSYWWTGHPKCSAVEQSAVRPAV